MKRYFYIFALLVIMILLTGSLGYGETKTIEKKDLKPMVLVTPAELTFNCNIPERAKQVVVTNASRKMMTINAQSTESWITVEPSAQPDVRPGGTATFKVTVNCPEMKGAKRWTGSVNIEGMGFVSKVLIIAKPKLEPLPRPIK